MIGKTLEHFRILEQLGAGGMGVVYRARDERLDRDVALKLLPADAIANETSRDRLLREARVASGLNHPNICTIYAVGDANGEIYIAMEYVAGETLSTILERGPMAADQVTRYAAQLADALEHAHAAGVVHRDFKSANVMITPEGRAKVLDFGLAKRGRDSLAGNVGPSQMSLTEPGLMVGTPTYMAPEQLLGDPADARSDVWALGVVLYEMVAATLPFPAPTAFERSMAIVHQEPVALSPEVPAHLRAVIERCLSKDPAQRYQRAGEVAAALEVFQATPSLATSMEQRKALAAPRVVSPRRWVTLTAGFVSLAALLAAFNPGGVRDWALGRSGPLMSSLIVLPLNNSSGDSTQGYMADGLTEALISELSKIGGLSVVSLWSTMQYRGSKKRLRDITKELGVEGAIEGGVLREGDNVRLTLRLIDGRTDKSLWSQDFDRGSGSLMALQSEVARAIAAEIRIKLSPREEQSLHASARTVNPEAYEAYLKGREHWYRQTPQEVDRALLYFQSAVEKDSTFPLAFLGMAYVWTYYASAGLLPPDESRVKLIEANQKALTLDSSLAEAHASLADLKFYYDWDWATAEKEYKLATALKPNLADLRLYYWEYLAAMKRPQEAEEQIRRCLTLDPLNPYVQMVYGMYLLSARRYPAAIAQFDSLLAAGGDFGPARLGLWVAYHHTGRRTEALQAAREFFISFGDSAMANIMQTGIASGDYQRAMRRGADRLAAQSKDTYLLAIQVAQLYAYAGQKALALDWLERSLKQRETGLVKLQIDPDWDTLREEPRFKALLAQMKFPAS